MTSHKHGRELWGDELWLIKGITAVNVLTVCHLLSFDLFKVGAPVFKAVCFVLGNTIFTY